jgi:aminoglycoside 6'-N-acetyltransferase
MPQSIRFRPLINDDLPLLAGWLALPHVEPWWREASDITAVAAAYGPLVDGTDPTEAFVALRERQPIGYIQRYRLDDNPEWQQAIFVAVGTIAAAGIDYLIGDERLTGQGLGRRMIGAFVDETWGRYPDITAIAAAVQQDNQASWRALEGAGFVRHWAGTLASEDPSDEGPSYVYLKSRPSG